MSLAGTLTVEGLTFRIVQVSPGDELLDDVLVTRFPATTDEPAFVRVAVFDAAENVAMPDARTTAHRAVAVARKWLRAERDALVAVHGAARELHNPLIPRDANPMTTAAWADVVRDGDRVRLLAAGRCADAEVVATDATGSHRLLTTHMLTERAQQAHTAMMDRTRGLVPKSRWAARRWHAKMHLLDERDWVNPSLGLTALPRPELVEGDAANALYDRLLVSTDGLELEEALAESATFDLDTQLAHLTGRTPPSGYPYPHGDIAAVEISAAD